MATFVCSKDFTMAVWETVWGYTAALNPSGFGPVNWPGPYAAGDYRFIEDKPTGVGPRIFADTAGPPDPHPDTGVLATKGGGSGSCSDMPPVVSTPGGNIIGFSSGGVGVNTVDATAECNAAMAAEDTLLEVTLPGGGGISLQQAAHPAIICGLKINYDSTAAGVRYLFQTKTPGAP